MIPHPDDEFAAWSLVEGAPDNYPVFLLLTHGEATTLADGRGLQEALGERAPQPQPFHGPRSLFARAQRLDSWHAFLDEMAALDPHLDVPPFAGHVPGQDRLARGFDVFVGVRSARVVFDLGDGSLDVTGVLAAIAAARRHVLPLLPVREEYGIVASGFFNDRHPGPRYAHRDHRAVHEALWHHDLGLRGPQWGRTVRTDPDVAATGGRVETVSDATYAAVMAVAEDGTRLGALQRIYGWLGFQDDGAFAPAPAPDGEGLFAQRQAFWRRF